MFVPIQIYLKRVSNGGANLFLLVSFLIII